ncbi:MAG: aminotransferase class IV [Solirubrobacteraceae bacterium]
MRPADRPTLLRYREGGLRPVEGEASRALLAADSWLVADGATRGRDRHWARFESSAGELGAPRASLEGFRGAVESVLSDRGRWFPRVELVDGGHLQLRLRPAPPPRAEARVLVGPPGDPRTRPLCKGPDLELLLKLRARAVAADADELLLCDDDGRLLEGALSALLWWEQDALCTTPSDRTLPSVTRELLLQIARERGARVAVRSPPPSELCGCEVWLVNAAHGIQVVTAWDGRPAAPAPRAEDWRAALEATARRPLAADSSRRRLP